MANDEIPASVRRFLDENINSVEELETLLLLFGQPKKEWTAEDVSRELYTSIDAARKKLAHLQGRGLASKTSESHFTYSPVSEFVGRNVENLAQLYKTRRVTIITLIYSKPSDQIRDFSDAFRLKPRPEEDNDD